jgi:hypothetical protein
LAMLPIFLSACATSAEYAATHQTDDLAAAARDGTVRRDSGRCLEPIRTGNA